MVPTIGRVVIYTTTEEDKEDMLKDGDNAQDKLPAIIVAVWGADCVNLKVLCDGVQNMWVTSATRGNGEREWDFPKIK